MSDKQLMEAFDFSEDDLAANRKGLMSHAQQQRLEETIYTRQSNRFLQVFVTAVLLVFGLIVVMFNMWASPVYALLACLAAIVIMFGTLVFALFAHAGKSQAIQRQIDTFQVLAVTDVIKTIIDLAGQTLSLQIADQRFALTEAQVKALHDGRLYTIYFSPHPLKLLSIEPYVDPAAPPTNAVVIDPLEQHLPSVRISDDGELLSSEASE
jgi:hypothetical protein